MVKLRVMSFNVWGAGSNESKTVDETVAIIRASKADIVGLQETRPESELDRVYSSPLAQGTAAKIARALGFYWHNQTKTVNAAKWANAILSRFPIEATTPHDLGVRIRVGPRTLLVFNVQLPDCPYQPFQVSGLPYCDAPLLNTASQAIVASQAARNFALRVLLKDVDMCEFKADAAFIVGDLNEPSHRDWTARAAAAGVHPLAVEFPTAQTLEARGFVDTYRTFRPDEVRWPGYTWPTLAHRELCKKSSTGTRRRCVRQPSDRIDYVFARGIHCLDNVELLDSEGGSAGSWPSDHRAVVATVTL
jgi:exodeoxyribonuclease-3